MTTSTFDEVFDITEEMVKTWADFSGDRNRLHVDPVFAATTPYGRCIAHGPILASLVGELLADIAGERWATSSHVEFRFTAPVFVPSSVTTHVELTTGIHSSATVTCTDEDGTTVLTANAGWQEATA
jgi:3-hydroxybutyryl-CoA dehydratase